MRGPDEGGVILFRSNGAAARRYVEADRSRAGECYLGADNAIAEYAVTDSIGEATMARGGRSDLAQDATAGITCRAVRPS